jgi:hypothetical protein
MHWMRQRIYFWSSPLSIWSLTVLVGHTCNDERRKGPNYWRQGVRSIHILKSSGFVECKREWAQKFALQHTDGYIGAARRAWIPWCQATRYRKVKRYDTYYDDGDNKGVIMKVEGHPYSNPTLAPTLSDLVSWWVYELIHRPKSKILKILKNLNPSVSEAGSASETLI